MLNTTDPNWIEVHFQRVSISNKIQKILINTVETCKIIPPIRIGLKYISEKISIVRMWSVSSGYYTTSPTWTELKLV